MSRTPRTRNMRQPQPMQERLITDYPFGRFWDVKGPACVQSDCVACLSQQLVVATLFPALTLGTRSLLSPAVLTRNNSHFTRTLFHCLSNSSSSKPQSRFGRGSSVTRRRRRRRQSDRGRDIDFLGPYDAFSPHSLLHGDADEWSEEEELYSWD